MVFSSSESNVFADPDGSTAVRGKPISDEGKRVPPDRPEIAKWDPEFTAAIAKTVGAAIRRYFRSEVRGLDAVPPAGGRSWWRTTRVAC